MQKLGRSLELFWKKVNKASNGWTNRITDERNDGLTGFNLYDQPGFNLYDKPPKLVGPINRKRLSNSVEKRYNSSEKRQRLSFAHKTTINVQLRFS